MLIEAVDHMFNSKEQALLMLNNFKKDVLKNLSRFEDDLKKGDDNVLAQTRKRYKEGLLASLTQTGTSFHQHWKW